MHEQQIFLTVIEKTEVALRIAFSGRFLQHLLLDAHVKRLDDPGCAKHL
jgi:hypothetical protein